ncbi:MAG: transglycosylase domain-containing protein, partial [Actinomycetota bacterium]
MAENRGAAERVWRVLLIGVLVALVTSSCAQVEQITSIKLKRTHLRFDLPQTSRIFASNGRLITTFHGEENRTIVKLRSLPDYVWRAIVAIEDERFFEHHGVDLKAVLRAAIENVTSGEVRQGGSTITQQYVKNMIISPEGPAAKTLERKIREAALARQLERRLTKREILSRYINAVYFGNGAYGVDEAARTYFRKPARRLKPWQAATVAGLIRNPSVY